MNHNVLISSKKRISVGNIFYLFLCFLLLSGCSKFQYVYIDSHLQQNEKKEFTTENDTVMIKYSFAGKDFPITLTIFNKLNQPLYITNLMPVLNGTSNKVYTKILHIRDDDKCESIRLGLTSRLL